MNIAVLGATGSVGSNALESADMLGARIKGVSVHRGIESLCAIIDRFSPEKAVITDGDSFRKFVSKYGSVYGKARILSGKAGLSELILDETVSVVVNALSGIAGLDPTLEALRSGKKVATANKESIVMGWHLIRKSAAGPASVIPVDSEHSSVFQLLEGRDTARVRKIVLTASGGAVYGKTRDELKRVTAADCLAHPTWKMGRKITVDSATLMNKGLEVIEACNLFDIGYDRIDVMIHPQSIVHALVECADGSFFAHLAPADMKIPISYAISYPARPELRSMSLGIEDLARLEFSRPRKEAFPCLDLAVSAGRQGGTAPVALCAADEAAVNCFLEGRTGFNGIPGIIRSVLEKDIRGSLESSDGIEELYSRAYRAALEEAGVL